MKQSKLNKSDKEDDISTNIYDLPSSDDEDRHHILRRKRRRYGTNGQEAKPQRSPIKKPQSTADPIPNFIERYPAAKSNLGKFRQQTKHESTEAKQQAPVGKQGPISQEAKKVAVHHPIDAGANDEIFDDTKHPKPDSVPLQKQKSTTPQYVSSKDATTVNTTPGRRRLIDSLGMRDRPGDISPSTSVPSIDNRPSSPIGPQTPPRPPQLILSESKREDLGPDVNTTISPHLQGSKVTYARQRSVLDDFPLETSLSLSNVTLGPDLSSQREPREPPHARLIALEDLSHDDGTVRSIHELRQAGGNARFRGVIELIFEDIEDSQISASGRCSACVQLCNKMLDPKLARQFVECNFDRKLIDCLSNNFDPTSTTLAMCVFGLGSLVRPMPYIVAKNTWPKLLEVAAPMLDTHDDINIVTQATDTGISKAVQKSVRELSSRLPSVLFPDASIPNISPRLVALKCLRVTSSKVQESVEPHEGLPARILRQIVNLLLAEASHPGEPSINAQVLSLGLSILEMHTTSLALPDGDHDILSSLSGLQRLLQIPEIKLDLTSQHIQTLFIRVILNVTNSSPSLCDAFATPVMVTELARITITNFEDLTKDSLKDTTSTLDRVILSLGALINLTEQSGTSRSVFTKRPRAGRSLLRQLLRLFLIRVDSTSEVCFEHE